MRRSSGYGSSEPDETTTESGTATATAEKPAFDAAAYEKAEAERGKKEAEAQKAEQAKAAAAERETRKTKMLGDVANQRAAIAAQMAKLQEQDKAAEAHAKAIEADEF